MRITYIHQYFNTPSMPGGTRSYEMARRLVAKGHEVNMVTSWREPDSHRSFFETTEDGIHVHWAPVPYSNCMTYKQRVEAFLRFVTLSATRAASIPADLVFATSTPLTIALPAVYAARTQSVPMVFEVRDLWPELPIAVGALTNPAVKAAAHWLERWAYKNAEVVVALSPGMQAGVCKTGYPAERVAVIPNSSDNALFESTRDSQARFRGARAWLGDRPLIVYAGTFGRINGVGYLVDLAVILREIDPDVRVLLLGDGQEKEQIIRDARAKGVLGVNLFIEPPVAKSSMPDVLAAADIACSLFVDLPEMQANSANKFYDALSSGTPVLVNYGGWHAKLLEQEDAGIVVWKVPLQQAAESIATKLRDRAWIRAAGRNARVLAERDFDRELLALRLAQVLELAQQRRGDRVAAIQPATSRAATSVPTNGNYKTTSRPERQST